MTARGSISRPTLPAPFPWFGGKSRAAALIWSRLGRVENYVEPFFGTGAVLLGRPTPPGIETINDADRYVANFWRAVQADPEAVAIAADNPVNEADLEARHQWLVTDGAKRLDSLLIDPDAYDAKIAGWWVWGACAWIGTGWCTGKGPWTATPAGWDRRSGIIGVNRQLPHLGNRGTGVNRKLPHPHLGHLIEYMTRLRDRLRHVRVSCGDWRRVLTPSVTFRHGMTGILLDPPYGDGAMEYSAGGNATTSVAAAVRDWAVANGDNDKMRIALCGYDGNYDMPCNWSARSWLAASGYSKAKTNRKRELVWFSPACIADDDPTLFSAERGAR